jgi:hypothetical protein
MTATSACAARACRCRGRDTLTKFLDQKLSQWLRGSRRWACFNPVCLHHLGHRFSCQKHVALAQLACHTKRHQFVGLSRQASSSSNQQTHTLTQPGQFRLARELDCLCVCTTICVTYLARVRTSRLAISALLGSKCRPFLSMPKHCHVPCTTAAKPSRLVHTDSGGSH